MLDVNHQVLRYLHDKYGSQQPMIVALNHEGRGIPRHVRMDLVTQLGREISLGKALEVYKPQPVAKSFR